jgi:Transposase domain (DUF772)
VVSAQLALATILQAYAGVSDDEVIQATVMDRRWQLVLDCLHADAPPFAKGTLVRFRKRLIERTQPGQASKQTASRSCLRALTSPWSRGLAAADASGCLDLPGILSACSDREAQWRPLLPAQRALEYLVRQPVVSTHALASAATMARARGVAAAPLFPPPIHSVTWDNRPWREPVQPPMAKSAARPEFSAHSHWEPESATTGDGALPRSAPKWLPAVAQRLPQVRQTAC